MNLLLKCFKTIYFAAVCLFIFFVIFETNETHVIG